MPHTKIKHPPAVVNGVVFGHYEHARWDERREAINATLVICRDPAGEWVHHLLQSLEDQDRLDAVGLAVELDIVLSEDETQVESIVRCHRVHLTTRSACGGGFTSAAGSGRGESRRKRLTPSGSIPSSAQQVERCIVVHRSTLPQARAEASSLSPKKAT